MPPSKSKRTVRAVRTVGSNANRKLTQHPAMSQLPALVQYRLGASEPLRLPDEASDPSAAKILKSEYTVSSDAVGHLLFGENHNLSGSRMTWAITASIAGTCTTTAHPQNTAFQAEARVARMVAMRITLTYIGAEQTTAGYLSYEEKAVQADVDGISIDALHTSSDAQVRAGEGITVYLDYTQTPRWEAPTANTFMIYTFPFAMFVASGLPVNTPVYRVRIERFMEYLPIEGTLSEGEVRHEPHDPGALGAHGALSGAATSVHRPGAVDAFRSVVKGAANAAYHMVQPVMPYLVDMARSHLVRTAAKTLAMAAI